MLKTYSLLRVYQYQYLSRRRINFAKSEVVFNQNVSAELKDIFFEKLGVHQVNAHSKYLGLMLCYGHNKTEVFKFLIEKTWQKVVGWKEKIHSAAGKEILIKAILQALSQYVMMCCQIPRPLCKRLSSIMIKF